MGGTYSTHGRDEEFIQYLGGKSEEKRPFGRPRSRYEIIVQQTLGK